jgi:hypothetical protein
MSEKYNARIVLSYAHWSAFCPGHPGRTRTFYNVTNNSYKERNLYNYLSI